MELNAIESIFFKLFTFLITVYYTFAGAAVMPSTDNSIKPAKDGANMTFVAVADPQISNYIMERIPVFDAVSKDLQNNKDSFDAIVMAGDIAENGLAIEYKYVFDGLSGLGCRYLNAVGNHDIRLRLYNQSTSRFLDFTNSLNGDKALDSLNYTYTMKGYKFIILGSERTEFEESYFSKERLDWLENEIAACNGKPCFVVAHQSLKLTHGLPDTWNSPFDDCGSIGDQDPELRKILTAHKNVIFITGHLHTGFGQYTYETLDGLSMVNLPSLCIKNKDGNENGPGIGCVVECYDNEILFRARNFATGKWLPNCDFSIPVSAAQ